MLFVSSRANRALNVPLMLLLASLLLLPGAAIGLYEAPSLGTAFGSLLALGFLAFALIPLRLIKQEGQQLVVRNVFRVRRLPLNEIALAISVYRSGRGGPTYYVNAYTDEGEQSLCEASSLRRAEVDKERLQQRFFAQRPARYAKWAQARQESIEASLREHSQTDGNAQADKKSVVIAVLFVLAIVALVMGLVAYLTMTR